MSMMEYRRDFLNKFKRQGKGCGYDNNKEEGMSRGGTWIGGNQDPIQRSMCFLEFSKPISQVCEPISSKFVSVGVVAVLFLEEDITFSIGCCQKCLF